MNSLWIPYIIFRNTDTDEAVTVAEDTRQTFQQIMTRPHLFKSLSHLEAMDFTLCEELRLCQTSLTGLDTRTLVSVTRQGDFVRSGPEVADEVTIGT